VTLPIASILLAACSAAPPSATSTLTPAPLAAGEVALPTFDWPAIPSGVETACAGIGLVDAHLMGDPRDPHIAWLVNVGKRIDTVWPAGFRARFDPELEVLDALDRVTMRGGDRVDGACVTGDPNTLLLGWP
jgi:hypothetical protein